MNLRRRLEALESAVRPRAEPFADPQYAVALHREILQRRAIPLPPLDGVDLDATAALWARGGDGRGFVMEDGAVRTAAELVGRTGGKR
jgi:hypothetical protein